MVSSRFFFFIFFFFNFVSFDFNIFYLLLSPVCAGKTKERGYIALEVFCISPVGLLGPQRVDLMEIQLKQRDYDKFS